MCFTENVSTDCTVRGSAGLSFLSLPNALLGCRVHLNQLLFVNFNCGLKTPITASAEGTTTQPLPAIICLLLREPFKKAAFTPEDLYTRTRSLDLQVGQEMEPPNTLQCELRSYQKQALHWMTQLEIGLARDNAADSLHPCWEAYHLAEGSELAFYLNVFSGEATLDFRSALQTARGGILADAMGLRKTDDNFTHPSKSW